MSGQVTRPSTFSSPATPPFPPDRPTPRPPAVVNTIGHLRFELPEPALDRTPHSATDSGHLGPNAGSKLLVARRPGAGPVGRSAVVGSRARRGPRRACMAFPGTRPSLQVESPPTGVWSSCLDPTYVRRRQPCGAQRARERRAKDRCSPTGPASRRPLAWLGSRTHELVQPLLVHRSRSPVSTPSS